VGDIWRGWSERLRHRWAGQPEDKRLSQDARMSLVIHFFFQFGASMSGVFLNLYLWRLTEDIWINGMYNIINYGVSALAFVLGGWLTKKTDRMYSFRLGLLLIALFYVGVIIAQEQVAEWYWLFALAGGLAGCFYWSGYLVLMYDVSDDRNRIHYIAMNNIFFTAAGLIGPALAGAIIAANDGLNGYMLVFGLAFVMFLLAALGSFRIKPKPNRHKAYYLAYSFQMMRRASMWKKSLWGYLIYGLMQGIMLFLPNILLFQVMPREDQVGYMAVVFSLITIFMGTLISKYARERWAAVYLRVSAVGLIGAACMLLLGLTVWTVVGFMVLYSFFAPLQGNTYTSYYYRLTGKLPLKGNFRVESVVMREVFLNTGRVFSIFALILFLDNLAGQQLAYILIGGALLQLLLPLMLREKEAGAAVQESRKLQA
jgi:MFS transporter, YQGE family, putative transporter